MGVKGGSGIMSREGHLLADRLDWDQLYRGNDYGMILAPLLVRGSLLIRSGLG